MLNTVDRVEKVLFRSGKFAIKNVIILGSKNSVTGVRIDPIHTRTYQSNKYVGVPNLSSININTSEYITFEYNDFDNKIREEVYISYPHMLDILAFMDDILNLVYQENFYTNNGINPQYYENGQIPMIISQPLAGGKYLDFMPSKLENSDGTLRDGGLITLNNNSNAFGELDIRSLETIDYILRNINLGSYSNQTLIISMLEELGSNKTSSNGFVQQQNNIRQQNSINNVAYSSQQSNKNSAGRRSVNRGVTANRGRNYGASVNVNQPSQQQDIPDIMEPETEPSIPSPSEASKRTNKKMISMNDILNSAQEIEVDLDDVTI